MVKNILIKSPDEWATTKQACRDESVAYLFLSSTNIYIYIFIFYFFLLNGSMFRNSHVRLIGAGQKRYFKIHTFGSNSPPHPGKVKFPTPGWPFRSNSRLPGQRKHSNARGLRGGGGGGGC